jgi:nitronate monooxygenase
MTLRSIIQAPMGGGPSTPRLAAAVSNAGGLGFLAGGYLAPEQLAEDIRRTRALTEEPFGVNLFAGGYHRRSDRDAAPILEILAEVHRELGLPAPSMPDLRPDPFRAQLDVVLAERPAYFSFTFGIPSAEAMAQLREAGIVVLGTATTAHEGVLLERAGVDAVIAQGGEAGAHRGSFAGEWALVPTLDLVRELARHLRVPIIASGGIMNGAGIARALRAGASAVQMGTAFLLCDEAGTSAPYRDALRHARGDETVVTRAYSGRRARGIGNTFIDRVGERDERILPYPIQNSLTRPMRAAAAAQGKSDYLSLWAGTGVEQIRAMPAAELVATLIAELRDARTGRPQCGEYGEHAEEDLAHVEGDDAVEALVRQERAVAQLLAGAPDAPPYAAGKWSLKQVVGHLIDDERIFVYRALCIARGDAAALESFDENLYVAGANFDERTLPELLREYALVRGATVAFFDSLSNEAWSRNGKVAGYTASVRGLAFHIAGHELHHLRVLKERYLSP